MSLTPKQNEVKNKLLDFIFDKNQKEIILQGHAGTGKTYLLSHLIQEYKDTLLLANSLDIPKLDIVFCATTNKAVEALQEKGIKAKTIHSQFRLNLNDDPIYTVDMSNMLVIIDECSYLNYKQFDHIRIHCDKVIYVGDKNQLTPIGLNHAPVYYADIALVELTETIRQQNAPEIGDYCDKLREAITSNSDTPAIVLGKEVVHLNQKQFEQQIKQDFANYDGSQKILGLKNTTVQKYNNLLTGITAGDTLINNAYHKNFGIANNATVLVEQVYGETTVLGVKVTHCRIYAGTQGRYDVCIPKLATSMRRAFKKAKELNQWNTYNRFIDLRQPYAQTIHKAQGSTYSTVYIHLDDLNSIETKKEKNRLLYVAFSRATDKVYLTGDLP